MNKKDRFDWQDGLRYQINEEVLKQKSDRPLVIIATIFLDNELTDILRAFLIPDADKIDNDNLFGYNRPIENFGPKIDLAYRLGLISDKLCKDLHYIRCMRNDFAHAQKKYKLNEDKVKHLSTKFTENMPFMHKNYIGTRGTFQFVVELFLYVLSGIGSRVRDTAKGVSISGFPQKDDFYWIILFHSRKTLDDEWIYIEHKLKAFDQRAEVRVANDRRPNKKIKVSSHKNTKH